MEKKMKKAANEGAGPFFSATSVTCNQITEQVVSYDPRYLADLVGYAGTFIPDDIIIVAVNMMRAYSSQQNTPYICFYSPAEIAHFIQSSSRPSQFIPTDNSSINIHHLPGHWVTSYYNAVTGIVHVYDSLVSHAHKQQVKAQLLILYGENSVTDIHFKNVTQQQSDPICGVLSIAFAFSCLQSKDPSLIDYDIKVAREHLRKCVLEGQLSNFPNANTHSQVLEGSKGYSPSDNVTLIDNYFKDQFQKETKLINLKRTMYHERKMKDRNRKLNQRKCLSDSQKCVEQLKDRQRKMIERQSVSEYKKDAERLKERQRKVTERQSVSEYKKDAGRLKDRQRKMTERQSVSEYKKDAERLKERQRKVIERQSVSEYKKDAGRLKDRQRKMTERQSVSEYKKDAERLRERQRKVIERQSVSEYKKDAGRLKDRQKKVIERQSVSEYKKDAERLKERQRKVIERQSVSEYKKDAERLKERQRKVIERQSVSEYKKDAERLKERQRKVIERESVSREQKHAIQWKDRQRKEIKKTAVTEKQQADINVKIRQNMFNKRQRLSDQQVLDNKFKDKKRKVTERQSLSEENKQAEQLKDKQRKMIKRKTVSNQRILTMHLKDRQRKSIQRRSVSVTQKKDEKDKDRKRKNIERDAKSNEQKINERIKDNKRKCYERVSAEDEKKYFTRKRETELKRLQRQNIPQEKKMHIKEIDRMRKNSVRHRIADSEKIKNQLYDSVRKRKYRALLDHSKKNKIQKVDCKAKSKNRKTVLGNDSAVSEFKKAIQQGPLFVCSSCLRLMFKQSVRELKEHEYLECEKLLTSDHTSDQKKYVCFTCHKYLKKQKMPNQNFNNKLQVSHTPEELSSLTSLEAHLIAQRMPFMKIMSRPSGGQKAISGTVVNVPVDTWDTCSHLPRPPLNLQFVMLKLKRKLEYKSAVMNQVIRPQKVLSALQILMNINPLYKQVTHNENAFDISNDFDKELLDAILSHEKSSENQNKEEIVESCTQSDKKLLVDPDFCVESEVRTNTTTEREKDKTESDTEQDIEAENHDRGLPFDTCLQKTECQGNEIFSIAPAEGNKPLSMVTDKLAEVLSFPVLFPDGQFGYHVDRNPKLPFRKYLNARLLHVNNKFASNIDYIFFMQYIAERKQIIDSVQIAMRKTQSLENITASSLRSTSTINTFVSQDLAYMLFKNIRGSPAYWQRTMYDLLGMVRQLGQFTWFLTLSSADLRWTDMIRIAAQQTGVTLSDDDIDEMTWEQRCTWIRNNPVTVARLFDYKVQQFFKIMIKKNKVLGDVTDFFVRTEFQQRGSPHVHCVLWVKDAPVIGEQSNEQVCQFVDKYIKCNLPENDNQLYSLVSSLQQHSHTRTCRKGGHFCRFHFPKPPVPYTIVVNESKEKDMSATLTDPTKIKEEPNWKEMFVTVQCTIQKIQQQFPDMDIPLQHVLQACNLDEDTYIKCLKNLQTATKILHYRQPTDQNINNYNPTILKAWQANMDLQYVTDVYSCIMYIVSYITKDERELSDLLRQASKQANDSSIQQQLQHLGNVFLNHREVTAQEAIYRALPLPLRRTSRTVLFVPTDLPEERVKIVKPLRTDG